MDSPNTTPTPPSRKIPWPLVIAGAVAVFVAAGAIGYFVGLRREPVIPVKGDGQSPSPAEEIPPVDQPKLPNKSPDDAAGNVKVYEVRAELPAEIARLIKWKDRPEQIAKLGWLEEGGQTYDLDGGPYEFNFETDAVYYVVGTFTYQSKPGRVILVEVPPEGPGGSIFYRVMEHDGKRVVLGKYSEGFGRDDYESLQLSQYLYGWDNKQYTQVTVDPQFSIPDLDFPKELAGPGARQILTLQHVGPLGPFGFFIPSPTNMQRAFVDAKWGEVTTATNTGAFYITSVHGTTATYSLTPNFFTEDGMRPYITWSDGTKNTTEYSFTDSGGCGRRNYVSVVDPSVINRAADLKAAGKTTYGDVVYELKSKEHPILKNLYEVTYWVPEDQEKMSFDEFLKRHPMFFWVDPFDRLIKFESSLFMSVAECAKPVIYLYPQKSTTVSVKIEPQGGLTVTEPEYNGGWVVQADPSGVLTEVSSKKTYPYLFWEGHGGLYATPQRGFVVAQAQVETFIREKLAAVGLNQTETSDFVEYWLPLMQEKPWYFITFMGTSAVNELAPLTIHPKPDTLIRVLMDFSPLEVPVVVEPLKLPPTPLRRGFTVIEWGGVKR